MGAMTLEEVLKWENEMMAAANTVDMDSIKSAGSITLEQKMEIVNDCKMELIKHLETVCNAVPESIILSLDAIMALKYGTAKSS